MKQINQEEEHGETMVKITEQFFKIRFPTKNIDFEKRCGYFWEWVVRFESGHVKSYMDIESLKAFEQINLSEMF